MDGMTPTTAAAGEVKMLGENRILADRTIDRVRRAQAFLLTIHRDKFGRDERYGHFYRDELVSSLDAVVENIERLIAIPPAAGAGVSEEEANRVWEKQCECTTWASADMRPQLLGNGHHEFCDKFEPYQGGMDLLASLVSGIEIWASQEDGVPDWLWEAYSRAHWITRGCLPPETPHAP